MNLKEALELFEINELIQLNDVTDAEIATRFRRLSKKYHPDNAKTGNSQKFMNVKTAYDIVRASKREIGTYGVRNSTSDIVYCIIEDYTEFLRTGILKDLSGTEYRGTGVKNKTIFVDIPVKLEYLMNERVVSEKNIVTTFCANNTGDVELQVGIEDNIGEEFEEVKVSMIGKNVTASFRNVLTWKIVYDMITIRVKMFRV